MFKKKGGIVRGMHNLNRFTFKFMLKSALFNGYVRI